MTPNRPWRRVRRVAPTSAITGMRFRYPMSTRIGLAAQAEMATFLCPLFMYRVIHLFSRSSPSLSTGVWIKSVESRPLTTGCRRLTTGGQDWPSDTSGRDRPPPLMRRGLPVDRHCPSSQGVGRFTLAESGMLSLLATAFLRYRAPPTLRQPAGKRILARRQRDEIAVPKSVIGAVEYSCLPTKRAPHKAEAPRSKRPGGLACGYETRPAQAPREEPGDDPDSDPASGAILTLPSATPPQPPRHR
jgi:hypothetical protein